MRICFRPSRMTPGNEQRRRRTQLSLSPTQFANCAGVNKSSRLMFFAFTVRRRAYCAFKAISRGKRPKENNEKISCVAGAQNKRVAPARYWRSHLERAGEKCSLTCASAGGFFIGRGHGCTPVP